MAASNVLRALWPCRGSWSPLHESTMQPASPPTLSGRRHDADRSSISTMAKRTPSSPTTARQFHRPDDQRIHQGRAHSRTALTMATTPARTDSGSSGQAPTTMAKSGSAGRSLVALSVARLGRVPSSAVAAWRSKGLSSSDATPLQSRGLDGLGRLVSPVDACIEKVEAAGIAPASLNRHVFTLHSTCADTPPTCLHTACADLDLRELVASWHRLSADVSE
jgi:hypothetical protein